MKILDLPCEYIRIDNSNYKNKNTEKAYLNNMRKNQFLKVKNSLLELEKDFIELKDRELKESESRREIEELFLIWYRWVWIKRNEKSKAN